MSHSKNEVTSRNNNRNNKFDIPKGLVAKRREELIKAGFAGYGAHTVANDNSAQIHAKLTIEEVTASDMSPGVTEVVQDKFPTLHRPMMPTRRLPSREKRPFSRSKNTLFSGEAHQSEQSSEINTAQGHTDLAAQLKEAVNNANSKYQGYLTQGLNQRKESGWFSWLRHGDTGQHQAEELNNELHQSTSVDIILEKLDVFFIAPDTRYNNHSFASYLLDELNTLLENLYHTSFRPEADQYYEKNSWTCVAKILAEKLPQKSETNNPVAI